MGMGEMVGTKQDSIKVFYINNIINHLRFQTRASILKIKQVRDHCSNCLNYQRVIICGIWNYLRFFNKYEKYKIMTSEAKKPHLYKCVIQSTDWP